MNYRIKIATFQVSRETPTRRYTLSHPTAVAEVARQVIPDDAREHFGLFLLNAQHGLVAYHEVSTGTLTASLVHPREVFGPALRLVGTAAVILVHNHPSGDLTPSREDLRLTRQLVEAGQLLDIPVHDHVIIGPDPLARVSLAERGQMGGSPRV